MRSRLAPPVFLAWVCLFCAAVCGAGEPEDYAPAPPDNPLKGFAPYAKQAGAFPHSLEFNYLPVRAVMTGSNTFDWEPLERQINDVASRGCQTVFRFFLEYPNRPLAVPQFLVDAGVRIHTNTVPSGDTQERMLTPDYADPRLRAALGRFIAALGARYDGDPRLGFITAGLLGKWGEWHDYPLDNLWATKAVQGEVMDAYEAAFHRTPVLLRYPTGENDRIRVANHTRPFGYHDDSFAWATMPTGRSADSWFFVTMQRAAGPEAVNKWRTHPNGGEVRPEAWHGLWAEPPSTPPGQEFLRCVEETHATWLMDTSIARELTASERARALAAERRLGYEFYVASRSVAWNPAAETVSVVVTVENRGVAPFYADWAVELAALDAAGKLAAIWHPDWKLTGLLPGDPVRRWDHMADPASLAAGRYSVLLRVPNPMRGGRPLRFANRSQDQHLPGWLTLGEFERGAR